jgi:hypothetical protein
MIVAKFEKQNFDEQDYDIDFNPYLSNVGDSISSIDVIAQDGIILGSGARAPSHNQGVVKFWISGGTSGTRYKITIQITTAATRKLEHEVIIALVEY